MNDDRDRVRLTFTPDAPPLHTGKLSVSVKDGQVYVTLAAPTAWLKLDANNALDLARELRAAAKRLNRGG